MNFNVVKQIRFGLTIFVASFVVALFLQQPVSAHNIGWKWDFPTQPIIFDDETATHGAAITHSANNYNNDTDLTVTECSGSFCGTLIFIEQGWGNGEETFDAMSYNYSASNECSYDYWPFDSTGYCNETNHKVDFGYIIFNTDRPPDPKPKFTVKHEAGHSFGLAHLPDCTIVRVMMTGDCFTQLPNKLKAHDKSDINAKY